MSEKGIPEDIVKASRAASSSIGFLDYEERQAVAPHIANAIADEREFHRLAYAAKIEEAYGLLWLLITDDARVHRARELLLLLIDKNGQRRGINAAKLQFDTEPSIGDLP